MIGKMNPAQSRMLADALALEKDNQRLSQQLPLQQELLSQITTIHKALATLQTDTTVKSGKTKRSKSEKGD